MSGKLVLRGTNSSGALVIVGIGLMAWGLFQQKRQQVNEKPVEEIGEQNEKSETVSPQARDDAHEKS